MLNSLAPEELKNTTTHAFLLDVQSLLCSFRSKNTTTRAFLSESCIHCSSSVTCPDVSLHHVFNFILENQECGCTRGQVHQYIIESLCGHVDVLFARLSEFVTICGVDMWVGCASVPVRWCVSAPVHECVGAPVRECTSVSVHQLHQCTSARVCGCIDARVIECTGP